MGLWHNQNLLLDDNVTLNQPPPVPRFSWFQSIQFPESITAQTYTYQR